MILQNIIQIVGNLEGSYKRLIIGVVILVVSAIVTRFIFKTIKWFLVIGIILIAGYLISRYI